MKKLIMLSALAALVSGCRWGDLKFKPSEYEFSAKMREFVDDLSPRDEACDIHPIAYISEGAASDRCADSTFWLLNYFEGNQVAKVEEGYEYESVSILCPIAAARKIHRFDSAGKKTAESSSGLFGAYLMLPPLDVASFHYRTSRDIAAGASYRDYGLYVLRLPFIDISLLRISTDGFDFLFIPFWRKDTSPRQTGA